MSIAPGMDSRVKSHPVTSIAPGMVSSPSAVFVAEGGGEIYWPALRAEVGRLASFFRASRRESTFRFVSASEKG
jgi:hypothetical protein